VHVGHVRQAVRRDRGLHIRQRAVERRAVHEHGGKEDFVGDVGLDLYHLPPRVDGQGPKLEPARELLGEGALGGLFGDDVGDKVAGDHLCVRLQEPE